MTGEPDPTRVAHFRIVGRLGAGGMGVVYRAEDEKLRRTVALKLLPDASGNEERRQRFLREARSAAAITHPNVAVIHAVDEDDAGVFIAMELVEGESLRARLDHGPLDLAAAREVATQIARGLAAAHAKGIVHRDLKPENVMITPAGLVKLLDFGLAKASSEGPISAPAEAALAKTATLVTSDEGRVMGTPEYMSPEQAMGLPLDVRSDVFSFGIVLYEMLAGARPFVGSSPGAVLVALARDPAPPLRQRAPAVDEVTEAVVARCLAKAPAQRFADAREIVAALTGQTSSRATTLSQTDVAPITRSGESRVGRGARWMVAGLLIVVALGVAGVWWRDRTMTGALAPPPVASGGTPSSTASPSSPGQTLTWAKMPMSSTPSDVAKQAFRRGMDLCASGESPIAALDEALAADPSFASAGLQRAFVGFCYARPLIAADRQAYRVALTHREALSAAEQALLDALGPSFGDPPDWKESERRIRARLLAKPDEPETWDALAIILTKEFRYKEATTAFAHEAELAPTDVWGHDVWAQLLTGFGDFDGARRVIADCNARRPENLHCRRRAVFMTSELGDCKLADQLAREITAVSPTDHEGWSLRARLGVSLGLSDDALGVLETTAQSYSPAADRAAVDRQAQFDRAWRHGDFAACDRLSAEAQRTASPFAGGDPQEVLQQLGALRESGDKAEVSRVARAALARLPALAVAERPGDDLTPVLLSFLIDAGATDADALRARRSQWLDQQRQRLGEAAWVDARFWVWAHAYQPAGEPTRAQSDDALAKLADVGGHLSDSPVRSSASIGALLLGAGRPQEAEPWLSKEVHDCLDQPDVPATYLLGRVYEDEGDNARACASYAAVLGAWGRATPRSVTADQARAHAHKLVCPP